MIDQLSTYFTASMETWALEREVCRRLAGDGSIAAGELPGGLNETPGFIYRDHRESVICPRVAAHLPAAPDPAR